MIDAHVHLDAPDLSADLDGVLARMAEAGVTGAVTIGADLASSHAALALAQAHPHLRATIGLHPHSASELTAEMLQTFRVLAQAPQVVAIGEIGLDYHYDFSPRDVQRDAFRRQLALAAELGLPVVIHEREAEDDVHAILDAEGGWARGGDWHCCSVSAASAVEIARHFYLGIAGWVTFPKGENIREIVRAVPLARLLLETDAPYIAPVPFRGKTNQPAYLPYTARAIAEVHGVTVDEVARVTAANVLLAFPRWNAANA